MAHTSEYHPSDYHLVQIYGFEAYGETFKYDSFEVWRASHLDWKTTHYPAALARENRRIKEMKEVLIPIGVQYESETHGYAGLCCTLIILSMAIGGIVVGSILWYLKM